MSQATQTATQTITTQIHLTNLGRDRYFNTRHAAHGKDVGSVLVRAVAADALGRILQGSTPQDAVNAAVGNAFGEVDADVAEEVIGFLARND